MPAAGHSTRRLHRGVIVLAGAGVLAVIAVVLRMCVGGVGGNGFGWPTDPLLLDLRLSRVLCGIAVGAALAVGGAILQTLVRNPLASPDVLGVSSGASLGVMVSVYVASAAGVGVGVGIGAGAGGVSSGVVGMAWQAVPALLGAAATLALVLALARRSGSVDTGSLVVVGVVVSILCGAGIMLLQHLMPGNSYASMRMLIGSISDDVPRAALWIGLVVAVGGTIAATLAGRTLDALALSADEAASVGVNVRVARWGLLGLVGTLTAAAVVIAGPIGFVGLIAPHAARGLLGMTRAEAGHRVVIGVAALLGVTLIVGADALVKVIDLGAGRLPLGILTALLGGPAMLVLLRRRGLTGGGGNRGEDEA